MNNNLPHIQSINFGENGVEIVYAEPADIEAMDKTGILRTRIVMCPARLVQEELAELIDDAAHLLDKILLSERNPETTTFRR